MLDVTCIGILVADVIARTVEKLPPRGTLEYKDDISLYNGGCAMSAAVGMSVLGVRSAIIGKTGKDSFGDFLRNVLVEKGVDISGLKRSDHPTSASVVLIDQGGERTFMHCPGANADFREEDIDWDIISASKIVFVAGTMLMPSFDGEPCARVLKKCREMGKMTALDTAWDFSGKWMSTLEPCMKYIDLFMPSVEEAEKLSGETAPEKMAQAFFGMGVKQVVIKLGAKGCYIQESAGKAGMYIPTYDHINPVCTTGAGDSFCAGFLAGAVKGLPFERCARLGSAVATHCVMKTGATAGLVSYDETVKFMEANEG